MTGGEGSGRKGRTTNEENMSKKEKFQKSVAAMKNKPYEGNKEGSVNLMKSKEGEKLFSKYMEENKRE